MTASVCPQEADGTTNYHLEEQAGGDSNDDFACVINSASSPSGIPTATPYVYRPGDTCVKFNPSGVPQGVPCPPSPAAPPSPESDWRANQLKYDIAAHETAVANNGGTPLPTIAIVDCTDAQTPASLCPGREAGSD